MKDKYKALFTADWHMSNKLPYSKPAENGLTDRFKDQLKVIKQIHKIADKEKVEAIFVLGDLFDQSRVDAVTLTHTVKEIVSTEIPIYILPGNHDANSIKGGRFIVEALGEMKNDYVKVIGNKSESLEIELGENKLVFWPVAFKPISETIEELDQNKKRDKFSCEDSNIVLLHNSINGASSYNWVCDNGIKEDYFLDLYRYVIAGHFHRTQELEYENGFYLGSPIHHHFGDAGKKTGVWIIEFGFDENDLGTIEKKFIKTKAPRFHLCKKLLKEHKAKSGDYLRYELKMTNTKWIKSRQKIEAKKRSLLNKGINVDIKHIPVQKGKTRLREEKGEEELSLKRHIREYVKLILEPGELSKKILVKLGIKIFEETRKE